MNRIDAIGRGLPSRRFSELLTATAFEPPSEREEAPGLLHMKPDRGCFSSDGRTLIGRECRKELPSRLATPQIIEEWQALLSRREKETPELNAGSYSPTGSPEQRSAR
jgi:hypothetical protein